jgi:hypothetical protein
MVVRYIAPPKAHEFHAALYDGIHSAHNGRAIFGLAERATFDSTLHSLEVATRIYPEALDLFIDNIKEIGR